MPRPEEPLVAGVQRADRATVARALNLCESRRVEDAPRIAAFVDALEASTRARQGRRIGFTGPPGVGKSTLVGALAQALRKRGRTVGVLAVDPSSQVSGGALLGDRARMARDDDEGGMFVRSLATAGETGGLTSTAVACTSVLAAAYDDVLVETVGVGQSETDVRALVDLVVLVLQPGSGDTLQFLKAGIMEIPDVFVVQKADHEALAARALADLRGALSASALAGVGDAEIPAVATSATRGTGIDTLLDVLDAWFIRTADERSARRARAKVALATRDFERRHGRHGVAVLGGPAGLATLFAEVPDASAQSLALHASTRYLARREPHPVVDSPETP